MIEEKDANKSAIRFLTAFEKASQPTKAVDPSKGAFAFPPLLAVAFRFAFVSRLHAGLRPALLAIGDQGKDAALAQGSTQRIAVIAFIEAEALGRRRRLPILLPARVARILTCSWRLALLGVQFTGVPLASMTKWRLRPQTRCLPE